ncbi:MAG: YciI family protein [Shimia sp.]
MGETTMTRYALMARDKADHLQTRLDNRAAHLAYIEETGIVEQAGPLLDEAGEMCGSLIVLNAKDLAAAQSWAAGDPYARAGLFENVMLIEWKKVIG